jgi:hypothetical protein
VVTVMFKKYSPLLDGKEITIVPYEEKYFDSYAELVQKYFGKNCFQANRKFIEWLYESPHQKASDFCIAITEQNKVVGFGNKMRLTWSVNGELIPVATGHNLLVAAEHRTGIGIKIIYTHLMTEKYVLVLASTPPLSNLHGKLGQQIPTCWYRKVICPIKGAAIKLGRKLNIYNKNNIELNKNIENNFSTDTYGISLRPDDDTINSIIQILNNKNEIGAFPFWNYGEFYWRFFHEKGPKHVLIYNKIKDTYKDFLIISLGIHKDFNLARIVEMSATSSQSLHALLSWGETVLKKLNAHVLSIVCGDERLNGMLQECGWTPQKNSPNSFFLTKNRRKTIESFSFNGSAGDFGFESSLTKIRS